MTKAAFCAFPIVLMLAVEASTAEMLDWLSGVAQPGTLKIVLLVSRDVLPSIVATATGLFILLASAGNRHLRWVAVGVALACIGAIASDISRHIGEISSAVSLLSQEKSVDARIVYAHLVSMATAFLVGCFSSQVAVNGHRVLKNLEPKRVTGKRAVHGQAAWMTLRQAAQLFPETGGVVIGERYRVDKDATGGLPFRADAAETWGRGGRAPLMCFDGSFGSSHGIVFAGSGGFKTSSVAIPTALRWGGTLIALDPAGEMATLVSTHRGNAGRRVQVLDPRHPQTGFNALDWIGNYGGTKEEDISAVASWIMSDSGRASGVRDDFFRASGLQLLTAMIADVCLSGHTDKHEQTLRQVRLNLSEPEPKLRQRLQDIYTGSSSTFVKENVAAFVNMTPETFSGVYANAVKETHWLSYDNYASLVSGSTFSTDAIAAGEIDVFLNIDLKTLETHSGLARVIVGSFINALYSRGSAPERRALFLLDEVARLGFMRILETARDTGRKYGISLMMLYQSIGQMREGFGGVDAASKWFESASWISFAGVNDPETADYVSRRCGMTTVEADQLSRSNQSRGSSRTRSKQLVARPLVLPHEVLQMRADEQIIFTAGNPPLRCGRAIWFRREDMSSCVAAVTKTT